jgi:hypothetical protein
MNPFEYWQDLNDQVENQKAYELGLEDGLEKVRSEEVQAYYDMGVADAYGGSDEDEENE